MSIRRPAPPVARTVSDFATLEAGFGRTWDAGFGSDLGCGGGSCLDFACGAGANSNGRSWATDCGRSECLTLRQASMAARKPGR